MSEQPMTITEKSERVRAMNRQWYVTFHKHGEKVADAELTKSMDDYFAEMDRRAKGVS